jgi:hypothetical protein
MRLSLFVFHPPDAPAFELWAPRDMRQVEAPESIGALVADAGEGFAPNLVAGHDRVGLGVTIPTLMARLETQAAALSGAEIRPGRTVAGVAGEVAIVAFTHDGRPESGPLYQLTACLFAPPGGRGGEDGGRDLIYLTGSCTVEQAVTWDPAFVDAAASVRFG